MTYLIILIVVAVAMIVAPVMALKPSKSQQYKARLREMARESGLQVQIGTMPQTHRQSVRKEAKKTGTAYRLQWLHPQTKFLTIDYLVHRYEVEPYRIASSVLEPLQHCLQSLPDSIIAVEFTNTGVAVYWTEQGGEELVAHIAAQLQALVGVLGTITLQSTENHH